MIIKCQWDATKIPSSYFVVEHTQTLPFSVEEMYISS